MDNKIDTTKEVFERREKVEELERDNTADELRDKLKTAKNNEDFFTQMNIARNPAGFQVPGVVQKKILRVSRSFINLPGT